MGRRYQGYIQADQSLREEDEENGEDDVDLEAGDQGRSIKLTQSRRARGKQRVAWGAGASSSVLRPNIHQDDKNQQDSSDDEPSQSFMIEATSPKAKPSKPKPTQPPEQSRLPHPATLPVHMSIPPRPSEVDIEESPKVTPEEPRPMRGLDDYERALWNWVNVYNLDAFLQEVYYYYQGKGIWCIALARGLNLLCVLIQSIMARCSLFDSVQWDLLSSFRRSFLAVLTTLVYAQKASLVCRMWSLIIVCPGSFCF
jgi:autophagy-related protein 9